LFMKLGNGRVYVSNTPVETVAIIKKTFFSSGL